MSVINESWTTSRDYPYPPARVFAAWADPAVKARWFDPSDEQESTYRGEFRVGGRESASTRAGTSPVAVYEAEYRDIVDGERIISSYEITLDGRRASVSLATVTFEATPAGTHLVYVEQGAYLDGLDTVSSRGDGTTSQLDRLADLLSRIS
jgi:uncharacterized protein YndB with AHSA1/START domain